MNVSLRTLIALAGALGCKPHELILPAAAPKRVRPVALLPLETPLRGAADRRQLRSTPTGSSKNF